MGMSGMSELEVQASDSGRTWHGFSFVGNGWAYFGICLRTFLLAVVTFGIYDPWGMVERRRYMLGNTHVAGHGFDYHADPKTILIGRLIGIAVILGLTVLSQFWPPAGLLYLPLFVFGSPWIINQSMRFHMRNTSYRNVRFNFEGTYLRAMNVFVSMPILVTVTFGFFIPWASRAAREYLINNSSYGTSRFAAKIPVKSLIKIFLVLWLIFVSIMVLLTVALAVVAMNGSGTDSMVIAFVVVFYFLLFIIVSIFTIKVRNVSVSNMTLEGGHGFVSDVPISGFVWRLVSRGFLATISVGFLIPWATVDIHRFLMTHTALMAAGDLNSFVDHQAATGGAFAAEYGSLEGFSDGMFPGGI